MWKPHIGVRTGKRLRHTAITALIVLAVLLLNFAFTAYARASNVFLDMTNEGRFTLRGRAVELLLEAEMEEDVDIIFCADADILLADYNTSLVYIMALELEKKVPNVHVTCVNAQAEPEKVAPYKRTSATRIAWNDVIVAAGTEFRVYKNEAFFTADSETDEILGFNGEQKMCEAILSLTAKDLPLACFTVGHGETLPSQDDEETGYFFELIRNAGLEVVAIDLERERIPDNCAILILNGPKVDYSSSRIDDATYESPITKIDRFLDNYGTVVYFRDATAPALPSLEEFLAEWGISFDVEDPTGNRFSGTTLIDTGAALSGDASLISGVYGKSSVYADITALSSPPKTIFENAAPLRVIWNDNASTVNSAGREVTNLFTTTDKAQAVDRNGDTVTSGTFSLMTMTSETRVVNQEYYTANLIVCGTTEYTSSAYLADRTYANEEVLRSLLRGLSRTVVSTADEIEFKFYRPADFTTSEDPTDNTIYLRDENGDVVWVVDEAAGTYEKILLRVIHPITDAELTTWSVVLPVVPLVLLLAAGVVVSLRRRFR